MRFLHTMVRVKDLDVSMRFWCDVFDLQEVRRLEHDAGRFTLVFLAARDDLDRGKSEATPLLELTYNWPDEDGVQEDYAEDGGSCCRKWGHLAYEVDDVYAVCQKLVDAGITINFPPRDGRMAFVKSPDGVSIELLQKGDALAPAEPWTSMENSGTW